VMVCIHGASDGVSVSSDGVSELVIVLVVIPLVIPLIHPMIPLIVVLILPIDGVYRWCVSS